MSKRKCLSIVLDKLERKSIKALKKIYIYIAKRYGTPASFHLTVQNICENIIKQVHESNFLSDRKRMKFCVNE